MKFNPWWLLKYTLAAAVIIAAIGGASKLIEIKHQREAEFEKEFSIRAPHNRADYAAVGPVIEERLKQASTAVDQLDEVIAVACARIGGRVRPSEAAAEERVVLIGNLKKMQQQRVQLTLNCNHLCDVAAEVASYNSRKFYR